MEAGTSRTLFRSYSDGSFLETPSWARLAHILAGDGGAYGLYGPRGSGKSWLMLRAVEQADRGKGMGLWFPCPSDYGTSAFLSALSDNLASKVEERYIRNNVWWSALRWLQFGLALAAAVPIVAAVVSYAGHGLSGDLTTQTVFSALPSPLWYATGSALGGLCVLTVVSFIRANRPAGRLAREATALRERIRYTTALKLGTELNVSGGSRLAGSLKRTREKDLDERPTTEASLVFDFRRLAEAIVATTGKRLVIGIDELDKIDDPAAARRLLRDIKGIFEITGVFFLISVSDEAATALQLGPLQGTGRNEFNSSFYTVLELPPLHPRQVKEIAAQRGWSMDPHLSRVLCLLSAGNLREAVRLSESWHAAGDSMGMAEGLMLARRVLAAEAAALLREVVRAGGTTAEQVLPAVWQVLPSAAFESPDAFDALSRVVINDSWNLGQLDPVWQELLAEPWRRFLIRLFVIGRAISALSAAGLTPLDHEEICDLRDLLIMAGHSTSVARLMLKARFGEDLAGPYTRPVGMIAITGVPSPLA